MTIVSPQTVLRQAEDFFCKEQHEQALAALSFGFSMDTDFRPFYSLSAKVLEQMGGASEARLFRRALEDFGDWLPFFDIGYHFIDAWQFDAATPFLEKAYRLAPQNPDIVHELALCYANTFRIGLAVDLLQQFEEHDFWTEYRLKRYQLLSNEDKSLAAYLESAWQRLASMSDDGGGAVAQAEQLLAELSGMERRYRELPFEPAPLGRHQLPYWHFVQYGGVILHLSNKTRQTGRFSAIKGSFNHVYAVLQALAEYLSRYASNIRRIVYLENWDDAVLGKALSKLMGLPAEEADGENLTAPGQLLLAANNASYNGEQGIMSVAKDQILFSFFTNWQCPAMLCPDISGVLATEYSFPWKEPRPTHSPSEDCHAEVVQRLLEARPPYIPKLSTVYQSVPGLLPGSNSRNNSRSSFRIESPVPEFDRH